MRELSLIITSLMAVAFVPGASAATRCAEQSPTRVHCDVTLASLKGYVEVWQPGPRKISLEVHLAGKTSTKIVDVAGISQMYQWRARYHHYVPLTGQHDGDGFWRFAPPGGDNGNTSVEWTQTVTYPSRGAPPWVGPIHPLKPGSYRVDLQLNLDVAGGFSKVYMFPKTVFEIV